MTTEVSKNTTDDVIYNDRNPFADLNTTSFQFGFKSTNLSERANIILIQPETILTLFLCFIAIIANVFSICATCHMPSGLKTHSKLIISLALSDLLIVFTVLTHILNKVFITPLLPPFFTPHERLTSACMSSFVNALNASANLISLLNLFAMAVDHYIAIMRPLHYPRLMNKYRGNVMIVTLWCFAFIGGFSSFFSGISTFTHEISQKFNYCEFILYNEFQVEYLVFATAFISLIAIMYIYLRIYCKIRNSKFRDTYMQKDSLHNNKAMVTTLLIIGTFILCWLPTCVFQIALIIQIHVDEAAVKQVVTSLFRASKYLYVLVLLNSICDPIIYAVRLKFVKIGYYRFLSRCSTHYHSKLQSEGLIPQRSSHV